MPPHLDPILFLVSVHLISLKPLFLPYSLAYPAKFGLHSKNWFHSLYSPCPLHPSRPILQCPTSATPSLSRLSEKMETCARS